MADGADMAGEPLDLGGGRHGAADGVRVVDSSGVPRVLPVEAGRTLAQTIWLSGEGPPPALCSGLGRCGACRVRFLEGTPEPCDADRAILGVEAVLEGWRLACRHAPVAGMAVALPPPPSEKRNRPDSLPGGGPFRLAVDLGTTSIHWRLLDGAGHEAASGQTLNPQMGAGSDVVSRLAAARTPEGRERLRHLVLRFLQRIVAEAGVPVAELCIAGNTAMTSILLDKDVAGLCASPYRLTEPGGRSADLPGLPPAWVPPQPAPFVGGDISAGMAAFLYGEKPSFPFLLADLGTNGEFVLAVDEERSFIASVPLGPSLEGIGLRYGGVADTGSVSGFRLGPPGLFPVVIGDVPPRRICGTGYLSLLEQGTRTGLPRRCARGICPRNGAGKSGLFAAGPAIAYSGGGQHVPARGRAPADAPGSAGTAGPLERAVHACGLDGPSGFHGPVYAAYGFRISAVRLQETAFCGIASLSDTL